MNFCLWITGLPGSGKSAIAEQLHRLLSTSGIEHVILSLDRIREIVTPEPDYTDSERRIVYRSLAFTAQLLIEHSTKSVIIDATGNRREYRDLARRLIPEFGEVYVACPIEVCKERESLRKKGSVQRDLYKKAARGALEGGLPGVTAPYEAPENAEIEVPSDILSPRESAGRIMSYITARWA